MYWLRNKVGIRFTYFFYAIYSHRSIQHTCSIKQPGIKYFKKISIKHITKQPVVNILTYCSIKRPGQNFIKKY